MELFLNKLKEFNQKWNDIPRKALIVVSTFIGLMLVWTSFRYLAPLVVALVFSWLVTPIAKPMERILEKAKLPKKIGALIAVLLVFGILFTLVIFLSSVLMHEAEEFIAALPGYIKQTGEYVTELWNEATARVQDKVGDEALAAIYDILMTALNKVAEIASNFAASLVSFALSAVAKMPDVILFVLFMIMECYYVVADRHDIGNFFRRLVPGNVVDSAGGIKDVMLSGVKAQFLTAVLQMLAAIVMLAIGFTIMDLNYAVMLALIISVLDALPVIGAGLIMFPMMGYFLVTGEYMLLLGTVVLYLIVQVVKRIMEPKILGAQMKLSQLATMVSMYAGYAMMGYIGLLIGPLMLKLFIAILSSSIGQPAKAEGEDTAKKSRRKK